MRSLTQDDSHVFCRPDQIEQEINNLLACAQELYDIVGMKLRVRLSYRDDGEGYLGELELWQSAQSQLKAAVVAKGLDYFEQEGEAAFYGPKIDFMATDAIRREHQAMISRTWRAIGVSVFLIRSICSGASDRRQIGRASCRERV